MIFFGDSSDQRYFKWSWMKNHPVYFGTVRSARRVLFYRWIISVVNFYRRFASGVRLIFRNTCNQSLTMYDIKSYLLST